LKLGMTLLISNGSLELALPNILWHAKFVDQIVCIANNPCLLLEHTLRHAESLVPHFKYLGPDRTKFTGDVQTILVNKMIEALKGYGVDWVINVDDDEFYVGPLRQVVEAANTQGLDVVYTDGFHFYSTTKDSSDRNPVRSMTHGDPDGTDYINRKAIHKMAGFLTTTNGNHFIKFVKPNPVLGKCPFVLIFHYCNRVKSLLPGYVPLGAADIQLKNLVVDTRLIALFDKEGLPV